MTRDVPPTRRGSRGPSEPLHATRIYFPQLHALIASSPAHAAILVAAAMSPSAAGTGCAGTDARRRRHRHLPPRPPLAAADAAPRPTSRFRLPTPIAPTAMRILGRPARSPSRSSRPTTPSARPPRSPAVLPPKLAFADVSLPVAFFVSVHVDPTGKALSARRDRDPIPSLAAESLKSMSRWSFSPGRQGGQPVDTWGAYRLDLDVEFRSPKIDPDGVDARDSEHADSEAASTGSPTPNGSRAATPRRRSDGTVPIDQVDTAPIPAEDARGPPTPTRGPSR